MSVAAGSARGRRVSNTVLAFDDDWRCDDGVGLLLVLLILLDHRRKIDGARFSHGVAQPRGSASRWTGPSVERSS